MVEQNEKDKAEAKEPRPTKPLGWRKFQKLLRQVIKSPPIKSRGKAAT
jgi:hypothetical protein